MIDLNSKDILFVSDVHYGLKNPKGNEKFIKFISEFHDYDVLVMLGDIFDFLYDPVENKYGLNRPIMDILSKIEKRKFFIPGNHDFWGTETIIHAGFEYYPWGLGLLLNNKKYFIHHGDGFNPWDIGYIALKGITHRKTLLEVVKRILPPSFAPPP